MFEFFIFLTEKAKLHFFQTKWDFGEKKKRKIPVFIHFIYGSYHIILLPTIMSSLHQT